MSGDQAKVEKKKNTFWPLNLLPGLTHMCCSCFNLQEVAKLVADNFCSNLTYLQNPYF